MHSGIEPRPPAPRADALTTMLFATRGRQRADWYKIWDLVLVQISVLMAVLQMFNVIFEIFGAFVSKVAIKSKKKVLAVTVKLTVIRTQGQPIVLRHTSIFGLVAM